MASDGGKVKTITTIRQTTKIINYEYHGAAAWIFTGNQIQSFSKVAMNGREVDPAGNFYPFLAFYDGGSAQPVPAVISRYSPDSPAYRGRAVMTMDRTNLEGFGNRLPSAGAVVVPAIQNLKAILEDLLTRCGIVNYEVDPALDFPIEGLVIASTAPVRSILGRLAKAYQFRIVDSEGKIKIKAL